MPPVTWRQCRGRRANCHGSTCQGNSRSIQTQIRQQLAAGKLVAANGNRSVTVANGGNGAKWGYGGGGHWIAVVGMDSAGNFLVMDPSTDCRKLSPGELSRYFSTHEYGGSAVAISR